VPLGISKLWHQIIYGLVSTFPIIFNIIFKYLLTSSYYNFNWSYFRCGNICGRLRITVVYQINLVCNAKRDHGRTCAQLLNGCATSSQLGNKISKFLEIHICMQAGRSISFFLVQEANPWMEQKGELGTKRKVASLKPHPYLSGFICFLASSDLSIFCLPATLVSVSNKFKMAD